MRRMNTSAQADMVDVLRRAKRGAGWDFVAGEGRRGKGCVNFLLLVVVKLVVPALAQCNDLPLKTEERWVVHTAVSTNLCFLHDLLVGQ